MFRGVLRIYTYHYICRCAEWNREGIQDHDAYSDRSVSHHCGIFCDKTGRTCGSKILPCAKCEELLVDDSGFCHGADVLLAFNCHGNTHNIWLLHEERYGDRGFNQKCRDIRHWYSDHGGTYDNPGGICILWGRSGYTSGRTITDVYNYSKGIPEHGIWNCHRNRVLPARTICCCHKLHSTY